MLKDMDLNLCPKCKLQISENFNFCPNCGFVLKEQPIQISVARQIGLYTLSLFLPPLGLWPGIKYLMKKDRKANTVGIVAIVLTFISITISVWISINFINSVNKTLQSQLQGYPPDLLPKQQEINLLE